MPNNKPIKLIFMFHSEILQIYPHSTCMCWNYMKDFNANYVLRNAEILQTYVTWCLTGEWSFQFFFCSLGLTCVFLHWLPGLYCQRGYCYFLLCFYTKSQKRYYFKLCRIFYKDLFLVWDYFIFPWLFSASVRSLLNCPMPLAFAI